MLRLHLVRHGKTERISPSGNDFDRRLIERGINQSRSVGLHHQWGNDLEVFCSSAERTRQTYNEIRSQVGLPDPTYSKELYLCGLDDYLDFIWRIKGSSELLFVGHNFGISDLATYLTDQQIELRTGEYIVIEFEQDNWNETSMGMGRIIYRHRL